MVDGPWSDDENDAIVADYFDMLADELSGRTYIKAHHNRGLQSRLQRSQGSIEFKHANISAALKAFGQPILRGYLPRFNFQMSLAEAVNRWLSRQPDWTERLLVASSTELSESLGAIYLDIAPTLRNTPPPDELDQMHAVARKFDVAAIQERNRALGRAGELRVLRHERAVLRQIGRADLAEKVIWTSDVQGDGAGYDIKSFMPDGRDRLIEVKTTNGWDRTPFHISRNELAVADSNRDSWHLFRLYNFIREPRAFEIRPPLNAHVSLTATSFQADFQ